MSGCRRSPQHLPPVGCFEFRRSDLDDLSQEESQLKFKVMSSARSEEGRELGRAVADSIDDQARRRRSSGLFPPELFLRLSDLFFGPSCGRGDLCW